MVLRLYLILVCLFVFAVGGCAQWDEASRPGKAYANILRSSDSDLADTTAPVRSRSNKVVKASQQHVLLNIEFVNVNADQTTAEDLAKTWQWVDETAIDVEHRSRLLANGIRGGLVSNRSAMQQHLSSLANDPDIFQEFLRTTAVATEARSGSDQISMRIGRRYELPVRKPLGGPRVTLLSVDGQTVGRTLSDPQFLFAVKPIDITNDRKLELRLRPEIQYGESRQRFVGSESALRINQRRETWSLDQLDLNLELGTDDLIVLSMDGVAESENPQGPDTSLGGSESSQIAAQMFQGNNADNEREQLFVFLRVSQLPVTLDNH